MEWTVHGLVAIVAGAAGYEGHYNAAVWIGGIWVLAMFCVVGPYRLWCANKRKIASLEERGMPRIRIFIDPVSKGILELPTMVVGSDIRGPQAKYVQISITPETDAALVDCEVHLISVERLSEPNDQLVEERVGCIWSNNTADVRKILVPPRLSERANLFYMYEGQELHLQTAHPKVRLGDGIKIPGSYRLSIAVTAKDVPTAEAIFIFRWRDFHHMSISPAALT